MIAIEEFKNKITKKSRLIGLDLGTKRIGIAICDELQSIATPFKTIQKDNFAKFLEIISFIIPQPLVLQKNLYFQLGSFSVFDHVYFLI